MYRTDKEFLENYDSNIFEKPSVAVDLLVYTIYEDRLKVLLVDRTERPFCGMKSLPGTFVRMTESLEETVKRVLASKVGIKEQIYFEQLFTWGDVDRDPRMRIISVSYMALIPVQKLESLMGKHAVKNMFYDVKIILSDDEEMAFDHKKIIKYGWSRIKTKAYYMPVAFEFLNDTFTLPELQRVYEILQDKQLYKTSFRRKIEGLVEETGEQVTLGANRPSKIYRRKVSADELD